MLAQLMRSFQRALALQPHLTKSFAATTKIQQNLEKMSMHHPAYYSRHTAVGWKSSQQDSTAVADQGLDPLNEFELDYLPYNTKEDPRRQTLIEALRTRYVLSDSDIEHILKNAAVSRTMFHRHRTLTGTLELLCMEGVDKASFMDYPWLLTLDQVRLKDKLKLIEALGIRDINEFAPFFRLTVQRLSKLVSAMLREQKTVPHGNRVYYISEMLKVKPRLVTKYLHKRLFILEMPFEMLEENLDLMIAYKVSPQNLLKDLWAFRYRPKAVQLRLERARRAKKDKIMPWMIRAPEPILQRSFQLTLDELEVLGDKKNVVEYVADRLGFDVESTKWMLNRHPAVLRVRVTKIKEILDYLLNETDFTRHEIAAVPRIMCHGLETTKQRIEELRSYGCRPTSLVIVCRSKREYDKFVQSWLETHVKIQEQAVKRNGDAVET